MSETKKISYLDLSLILSNAKAQYVRQTLPMRVSNIEITPHEAANVALLEAFIVHLTALGVLNKQVKIDHK